MFVSCIVCGMQWISLQLMHSCDLWREIRARLVVGSLPLLSGWRLDFVCFLCVELPVDRAERSGRQRLEQQGVPHSTWMEAMDLAAIDGICKGEGELLHVRSAFGGPIFYF